MRQISLLALLVAALGAPLRATGQNRVYLERAEVELVVVGRSVLSRNLSSGMVSQWRFRPDGTVEAVSLSGMGKAEGTWTLHEDGRMCVSMLGRIGCRYWFRQGDSLANAESRDPNARTIAVVDLR